MQKKAPTAIAVLLFFLFFCGLAMNVLAFVDLQWTHLLFSHQPPGSETSVDLLQSTPGGVPEAIDLTKVQQLKQSILNVRAAQCAHPGENLGTGFVVKPGFIATAAHVLGD